jgi:Fe-S-cluster-containing hydrogenase component 2
VCLFVCPTGATDTENGQIDFDACLDGCRLCVDACPSHAIYLVYDNYPAKPDKHEQVKTSLMNLLEGMSEQRQVTKALEASNDPKIGRLAKALSHSLLILSEDSARESGFLLPKSERVGELLEKIGETSDPDFPSDAVSRLKELLDV